MTFVDDDDDDDKIFRKFGPWTCQMILSVQHM